MSTDPVAEYAEGLVHLELGRTLLAVQDFFNVVDSRDASPDLKARARLARGRTAILAGAELTAISEWAVILELPGVSPEIAAEARQELCRLAGVTAAPDDLDLQALFDQCRSGWAAGRQGAAMAALELVLHHPRTDVRLRARAIGQRGAVRLQAGQDDLAAADWNSILHAPDADDETRQRAREGLERIALRQRLSLTFDQLAVNGHHGQAIAEFQGIMDAAGGNGFEQYIAAMILLQRFPRAGSVVRGLAREVADQYRPIFGELPAELIPIPEEPKPIPAPALPVATINLPHETLGDKLQLLAAAIVGGMIVGAIQFALMFALLGIMFALLMWDWRALVVPPMVGAFVGLLIGFIAGVFTFIGGQFPPVANPGSLGQHCKRGLIAAVVGGCVGGILFGWAASSLPYVPFSWTPLLGGIAMFSVVFGVVGLFTDS